MMPIKINWRAVAVVLMSIGGAIMLVLVLASLGCAQERIQLVQEAARTATDTAVAKVLDRIDQTDGENVTTGQHLAVAGVGNIVLFVLYLIRKRWFPMGTR